MRHTLKTKNRTVCGFEKAYTFFSLNSGLLLHLINDGLGNTREGEATIVK